MESKRRPRTSLISLALRLIRRVHLYSGLFLFPWVVLYGVTGYLFNHPRVFSDQAEMKFGTAEIAGTPLQGLPRPASLAAQVVAAIAREEEKSDRPAKVQLVEPESARFSRGQALVSVAGAAARYSVMVDLSDGTGSVRSRFETQPKRSSPVESPFADRDLRLAEPLDERLRGGVTAVLGQMKIPAAEIASVSVPDLLFQVEADGKPYQVAYSPDRGSLVAREAGAPATTLTTRSFLTRLHLIHGYPSSVSARWFWAIVVDAMFVAMCFWGLSGILMWWQLRATRVWGVAFLLASVAIAAAMTIGMHREMQAAPPTAKGSERGSAAGGRRERQTRGEEHRDPKSRLQSSRAGDDILGRSE